MEMFNSSPPARIRGKGVEELLEAVLLQAELLELNGGPRRPSSRHGH